MNIKVMFLLVIFSCSPRLVASCVGLGCTCIISNVPAVAFGNYNPVSGTALAGTGTINVTCSVLVVGLNVSYVISLNAGVNGTFAARKMNFVSASLLYNLYTNATYANVWGDGTAGTSTISDSYFLNLLTRTVSYTVYGLIPASQVVAAGAYTDVVTVTVTY